jgi:hypothetical protein
MGEAEMTGLLLKTLIFIATFGAISIGYIFYQAAMSPNDWIFQGGSSSSWKDGGYHGAPRSSPGFSMVTPQHAAPGFSS